MTLGVTPEGRSEEGRGARLLLRGHSHGTYSDRLMKDHRRCSKPFVVDSMLGGGPVETSTLVLVLWGGCREHSLALGGTQG